MIKVRLCGLDTCGRMAGRERESRDEAEEDCDEEGDTQIIFLALSPSLPLHLSTLLGFTVSRYVLKSDLYEFEATVDINIDIFPLQVRHCSGRQTLRAARRPAQQQQQLLLLRAAPGSTANRTRPAATPPPTTTPHPPPTTIATPRSATRSACASRARSTRTAPPRRASTTRCAARGDDGRPVCGGGMRGVV